MLASEANAPRRRRPWSAPPSSLPRRSLVGRDEVKQCPKQRPRPLSQMRSAAPQGGIADSGVHGQTSVEQLLSAQIAIKSHWPIVALAPPAGLPARPQLDAPARGEGHNTRQSPLARRAAPAARIPGAQMPSEDDLGGASRATGGVSCSYLHAVKPQLVRHEREN